MIKYMYEEEEIVCNYMKCAAGMGMAGRGICFLKGDATKKECAQFVSDGDFQKEQEPKKGRREC